MLHHFGQDIILGCVILEYLPGYDRGACLKISYSGFSTWLVCPVIVCRDLLSQQFNTVPDILLVQSVTEVVVVDALGSYLSKDMKDCTLLASREPVCCYLLLPRDID